MEEAVTQTQDAYRRYRRMAVRLTIASVLSACCYLWWLSEAASRRSAAVSEFRQAGGQVTYFYAARKEFRLVTAIRNVPVIGGLVPPPQDIINAVILPQGAASRLLPTLKYLAECSELEIYIDRSTVPAITSLPTFPLLKSIKLEGDAVTSNVVAEFLSRTPNLESLCASGANLSDDVVPVALAHESLTAIEVSKAALSDAGASRLLTQRYVDVIDMNHNYLTSRCVNNIVDHDVSISYLDVSYTQIDDHGLSRILSFSSLSSLCASGLEVGVSSIGALRKNTQLESLYLDDLNEDFSGVALALTAHPRLRKISIRRCRIGARELVSLMSIATLKEIDARECGLTEEIVESAKEHVVLEKEVWSASDIHVRY